MYLATKKISQLLAGIFPPHRFFLLFLKKDVKGENITFQEAAVLWEYTTIMRNNSMEGNFFLGVPPKLRPLITLPWSPADLDELCSLEPQFYVDGICYCE